MAYSAEPIADAALAWYRLGEASGTTLVDSSGNARNGTIDTTVGLAQTGLLPGDADTCWYLDGGVGAGEGGSVASAAWNQPTVMTAMYAYHCSGLPSRGQVLMARCQVESARSSADSWFFIVQSTGQVDFGVLTGGSSTSTTISSATGAVVIGTKYHIAGTYDGANMVLYINGAQVATSAKTGVLNVGSRALTIGRGNGTANAGYYSTSGYLDEVSFYGTALSAARIAAHSGYFFNLTGVSVTGLAALPYNTAASVSWNALAGATTYDYRVNGGAAVTGLTTTTVDITGLTNGTPYTIEVRPVNSATTGDWSPTVTVTPAAVLMYDTFNRTDVVPSTSAVGTSTDGHAWSQSLNAGLLSGKVYATATTENLVYITGAGFDQDITMTITTGQVGGDVGLIFRMRDTSNYWLITYGASASVINLYRKVSGTFQLFSNFPAIGLASAVIRAVAYGTSITLYVNGVCRFVLEDTVAVLATDTGLGLRINSTTARIDAYYAKAATQTLVNGYVYKGRDSKAADTVGES